VRRAGGETTLQRDRISSPTTKTFLPLSSNIESFPLAYSTFLLCADEFNFWHCLSQFQGGECKTMQTPGRRSRRRTMILEFAPAQLFKVVVQGGHSEDTLLVRSL